ncbi:related to integral membrane protein [Cephalotrichum gorgonifer]|uniref:Related to integral membrane protein n=1 Tax=Cephalotrichum gorgonifer TaxID=2041049 RepID=A0AAE8MYY8_9PEZI|nr:related to integral membrane protein [Cephalotrichum gorgonifer]
MAGSQAALIVSLRLLKERHIEWPMTLMAILSAVLLAAGVLRHYWDIWVHRTVRGISFIFVGLDAAGDVFSLLSILYQPTLDILGIVIYATEFVLWCGIFLCGGYYNLLPWIRKRMLERSRDTTENESRPAPRIHATANVTLHDIPSSTSVFRTAASDLAGIRPRTVVALELELGVAEQYSIGFKSSEYGT